MSKVVLSYENFINESQSTLFGNMDEYIDRFKNVPGFEVGEYLPRVAGTPNEFPEIDSKGNWKTDGWNYTSIRTYTQNEFKNSKEVLNLFLDKVIGPNKKEWKATNLRKPNNAFDFQKKDLTVAMEKPGLGIIFFYCWDAAGDTTRTRSSTPYKFQIRGMFLNAEQYWGDIEKYPVVKTQLDDIFASNRMDDAAYKAIIRYIENRYMNR